MSLPPPRLATLDDAGAVGDLLMRSYGSLFPAHYPAPVLEAALPLMGRANPDLLNSGRYFLLDDPDQAGRCLGCGGWTPESPGSRKISDDKISDDKGSDDEGSDDEGHIRHFATDPLYLRRGIGRAIIEACFKQARQQKIRRLWCLSSLPAVAFYQAQGFHSLERQDVALKPGVLFTAERMYAELSA